MSFELKLAAERDIEDILTTTLKHFGPRQLDVYTRIIEPRNKPQDRRIVLN